MFLIIFAEKSETEFSLTIIEYNYFEACMCIKKIFKISDSELKVNSIIKLFRLSDTFVCLIFKELFIIEKKTCRKLIICCSLKKVRFSKYMRIIIYHI